jgi:predicted ATPase
LAEYDRRVADGRLRDDEHQRTIIQNLQDLHEMLLEYDPPKVVQPTLDSLQPPPKKSFFGSFFGGKEVQVEEEIPKNIPKGLYMYGDVGSGKTMLMDLFFDTLPDHIQTKTRIHFHNFMQQVHKDLHKVKMTRGNDFDGIPFVAAGIAEKSSVLCFDEFQCTDVADAMILRRFVYKFLLFLLRLPCLLRLLRLLRLLH